MTVSNGYTAAILLKQKGDNSYETLRESNQRKVKFVVSGKINGNKISLKLSHPQSSDRTEITATVSDDKMQGNWVHGDQSGTMEALNSWAPETRLN